MVPDDDQAMVLPCASVIVIMVLLNVAFTCATPDVMFLRSRRRMRGAAAGAVDALAGAPAGASGDFAIYALFLPHLFGDHLLAGNSLRRAFACAGVGARAEWPARGKSSRPW